jgi:hypothetical protein
MGLIPDRFGGVRLVTDDCYEVVPLNGVLQLDGNCYACCTCDQYVAVAKAVKDMMARAAILKDLLLKDITGLGPQYIAAIQDYNMRYFPSRRKLYAFVKAIRGVPTQVGHEFAGAQQTSISVRMLNRSDAMAEDLTIKLETTPATTILSATFTKGDDHTAGSLSDLITIGDLPTNEGAAITWYVTTGSPNDPVSNVKILLNYTLAGVPYVDQVVFDGPPEFAS